MNFQIQTGEVLQIIYCNYHWFTIISSKGSAVKVFDSMYCSVPTLGKVQIACLLHMLACTVLFQLWERFRLLAIFTLRRILFKSESWMFKNKYYFDS